MSVDLQKEPVSVQLALSFIQRFSKEQFLWHFDQGLVLQAVYKAGLKYNRQDFTRWVSSVYDGVISDDGSIAFYSPDDFCLDSINSGKLLFDLYKDFKNEKYRKALDVLRLQLSNQPRTEEGGFWHKKIYPWQMFLGGLYMAVPFYSRYAVEYGSDKDFDDVLLQFELMYSHARDSVSGLLYHAWDSRCKQLWADVETGCSGQLCARAMGWFCMACVDVLDSFPNDGRHYVQKENLLRMANSLIKPLIKVQDENNGLWYQVLNLPDREKNFTETSSSAMFVYFLYKMVREGYLSSAADVDSSFVIAAAKKGYEGLCTRLFYDASGYAHVSGTCAEAGLGGNPYRDGSFESYVKVNVVDDDLKGIGAVILASLEHEFAVKQKAL